MITIRSLHDLYTSGSSTPSEESSKALEKIEKVNPKYNAFITVTSDLAVKAAQESDARYQKAKPRGPLDGIPIAVKDLIYIEGVRCTAGSRILAHNIATYDAPVVRKLKEAGAVIVGTTNLHEFAAGVTSDNPHYGPVRNPWDRERVAGGSSGGSAVAVSMDLAAAALGTDTAGSVRIPASLCGLVGFKPTYGRISRLGVIPLSSSLDTVGTLTGSFWDAAAMLSAIAGPEAGDSTAADSPVPDYLQAASTPPGRMTVGVPRDYFLGEVDEGVADSFQDFLGRLNEIGFEVRDVKVGALEEAVSSFYPIRRAEATAFHLKWLDSNPEMYGDDVRKLLELGRNVTAVDYIRAINARPSLMEAFARSMKGLDMLAVPSTSTTAPTIGEASVQVNGKTVDTYSALNRLTLPFNVVGFPSVSLPMRAVRGLPAGAQLIASPFGESTLLQAGASFESVFGPFPVPPS